MITKINRIQFITLIFAMIFSISVISCTEEKNETVRERNADIENLGESLNLLKKTRDDARYGTVKGNFPEESKEILNAAMAEIAMLIFKIDNGESVSAVDIEKAKTIASAAITAFNATVRTETLLFPAELYVNGNDGGYIDFGYSQEYNRFGANGNQAFTIELWVKYKTMPGGIGAIVSTFLENDGYRCGWMMNMINSDYLRISCTTNQQHGMWEPGDGFRDVETWVHIAAVYNDHGLDGDSRKVLKFYRNGELKNSADNDDAGKYYNPVDGNTFSLPQLSMIAFAQFQTNGDKTRKMEGYIKHFRIWKSAKTVEQIKGLMDGSIAVTGSETDLACAWAFDKQVEDDKNIKDLTGRHTASVQGNYK